MRMNERFATLYMMFKGKKLGLDFSEFDATLALGAMLRITPMIYGFAAACCSACGLRRMLLACARQHLSSRYSEYASDVCWSHLG